MTTGETVHLTRFSTEFGTVYLASTKKGVVACTLPGGGVRALKAWIKRTLPNVEIMEGMGRNLRAVKALRDYLAGKRADLELPLDVRGTDFQLKVWSELRKIPYGDTVTYAELAKRSGNPKAVRACGSANGSNPLPLFIPCHRVVASDGSLGGFGGGLKLKRRLLDLEQSPALQTA